MTRIAYIASRYPAVSHTFIAREVRGLRVQGLEVHTFSIRRSDASSLSEPDRKEARETVVLLPTTIRRLLVSHGRAFLDRPVSYVRALIEALGERPAGLGALLWQLFYFAEAGILVAELRTREIRHVHAHFANVAANVAKLAAAMSGRTWSLTLHGLADFGNPSASDLRNKIRRASMVVCVSDCGRAQTLLHANSEDFGKIHRVYCGINAEEYAPRRPLGAASFGPTTGPFRVLTVARIEREKGLWILAEAVARVVDVGIDVQWTIIGDGRERRTLTTYGRSLGIEERVRFAGALGQDDVRGQYDQADAFVLPSLSEGLPVVLMEAMSKEVAVVATGISGIPELIEHGISGLLVPPGRVEELAEAMIRLAKDPDFRLDLARAGRARVVERFSAEEGYRALARLFRRIDPLSVEQRVGDPAATSKDRVSSGFQSGARFRTPSSITSNPWVQRLDDPGDVEVASKRPRVLVISPVRDEAKYLQRTIASMEAQTVRPTLWIIVDDGSKDETGMLARAAAARHDWIRVHVRADRGVRKVGGGVIDAFRDGLAQAAGERFDFLCKLDGDLEFGPTYFQRLLERFESDPLLGTASGKSWIRVGNRLVPERTGDEFSQGQTKLYRAACYRDIGGFVNEVMWDGLDCHRCRMLGWRARSFHDQELRFIHLRPMGSSFRGILHGRVRWGRGQYFMGTHPLYAAAIVLYRFFERPFVLGGLGIMWGYLKSWITRERRYPDAEFRRHLHQWQLSRLNPFRRGKAGAL